MIGAFFIDIMPDMALDEIKKVKLEKLEKLKALGINPYPATSNKTHSIQKALESFDELSDSAQSITLVGRIMAIRSHGGSIFFDINDGTSKIQSYIKEDIVLKESFDRFVELYDIGDFIEVNGILFKTKKDEKTLEVRDFRILSKALLPLPEKWHGLQDIEERFRKRYLDILLNDEVKQKFILRSNIIKSIRNFMDRNDFIEVSTPTLQPLYGGASARPFKTHMHTLDMDLYLRIAPELYLKRLLVGGMDKVFEFTTNFRNEGIDRDHNPEFSAMEFYASFKDLDWAMNFTEEMFDSVTREVFKTTEIYYEDKKVDFKKPYTKKSFSDLLKEHTDLDFESDSQEDFENKAKDLGIKIEKFANKSILADEIFKKHIRPRLIDPTFVTSWPMEILPLAKRIGEGPFVDTFQFFAGGLELIKAFSELNDPTDQRKRFESQEKNRAKGDQEAQRMDEDYVEAMEYGMPPAAGWGLGIDRLVALLTNSHTLREIILFPLMRSKPESDES